MVQDVEYSEHTLITCLEDPGSYVPDSQAFSQVPLQGHGPDLRSQCSMRSSQCPLDFSYSNNPSLGSSLLGDPEDHTVRSQEWYLTQSEGYSLLQECQEFARVLLTRDVV